MLIGGFDDGLGTIGILGLNGGTVSTDTLEINNNGLIDIGDGDFYLSAGEDAAATAALIAGYISNGSIIGYGGAGTVLSELEGSAYHVYSVIPEPATMSLLALGGLALIRRKK